MTNDKYNVNDILNELNESTHICLTEVDFYPPYDNRTWKSGVEDIFEGKINNWPGHQKEI